MFLFDQPSASSRRAAVKTIRLRDKEHCKYVATQPCVICGRTPAEAHHLRFAQPRALGRKVSDEYTVPVCRLHHRELHRYGDEASWWASTSIDPLPIALESSLTRSRSSHGNWRAMTPRFSPKRVNSPLSSVGCVTTRCWPSLLRPYGDGKSQSCPHNGIWDSKPTQIYAL